MKARELYNAAPWGAYVRYSDGTPKPPAHHKRKLRAWESRNGAGRFVEISPSRGQGEWDKDSFVLRTVDDPSFVVNQHMGADNELYEFEFTPPQAGTILAFRQPVKGVASTEVRHVWQNFSAALAWADGRYAKYDLRKLDYDYMVITEDGTLEPYDMDDAVSSGVAPNAAM